MPTPPMLLAYPSDEDIRYALWLKRFAAQLPGYAQRYDLLPLQVTEVQCVAGEFAELLSLRIHYATTAIVNALPVNQRKLKTRAVRLIEDEQALRGLIAEIVAHVRRHPAYTDEDGLRLTPNGVPAAH